MSSIITRIRRGRKHWGLTQRELALLVGLTTGAQISALELGRALPSARVLLALQIVLGLSATQLLPRVSSRVAVRVARAASHLSRKFDADGRMRATRVKRLLELLRQQGIVN